MNANITHLDKLRNAVELAERMVELIDDLGGPWEREEGTGLYRLKDAQGVVKMLRRELNQAETAKLRQQK